MFLNFVKQCIPFKTVTIREDDKPWYDSEIRSFSRKRDKQKSKAIKTGISNDWHTYKKLRNKVNNLKKHAKEQFFNNLELSISDFDNDDKRKFWKVISEIRTRPRFYACPVTCKVDEDPIKNEGVSMEASFPPL